MTKFCIQAVMKDHNQTRFLPFMTQSLLLTTLYMDPFENNVGNREYAGNQHFLLFPQCFLSFPKQISVFQLHLFCCIQISK